MAKSSVTYIGFKCPECGVLLPAPDSRGLNSLNFLRSSKMPCPSCYERFIVLHEKAGSSDEVIFKEYKKLFHDL